MPIPRRTAVAAQLAEPEAPRTLAMPEVDLPPITEPPAPPIAAAEGAPPADEAPAPHANGLPPLGQRTLNAIHDRLCKPFPLWAIEVKPSATTKDKARALAIAYVDPRQYQTRLDRLAGPEGWAVAYRPVGERAIVCALTILGVTREDVGECDAGDPNQMTSAAMQAFKRACAAFGMGRYLYSLPAIWGPYDSEKRQFENPAELARQIYDQAGLPLR